MRTPRLALFFSTLLLITLTSCSQEPPIKLFNEAETLLSQGEYARAIDTHSRLLQLYPDSPYANQSLFKKGLIYYHYLDNTEMALKSFNELAYLYPQSERLKDAARDKGEIYSIVGEHWKAVGQYEWLLKVDPTNRQDSYHYLIGMEYFKMNDFRQARIEFSEIITNNPASALSAEIKYHIATTFYLEGDLKSALTAYREVVETFPDTTQALESKVAIAQTLTDAGRLKEALKLLMEIQKEEKYPEPDLIKLRIEIIEKRLKKPIRKNRKRARH